LFISFEGIEGSGKSTQAKRLYEWFKDKGYKCVLTREPGKVEEVRRVLLDKKNKNLSYLGELFLYLADRAENVEKIIIPAIKRDKIVITDRFVDSTIAYQGKGRGLDVNLIAQLNKIVTKGVMPDVTILLDVEPQVGLSRIKQKDRLELEGEEFYQKVRKGYLEIAEKEKERIKIIDGKLGVEEVSEKVKEIVWEKLKKR